MNDREILIAKTRSGLSGAQPKWVTDWHVVNEPQNSAAIPETLDGTRHNENIDQWLRPRIRFTFNFQNENDYAEAEKIFVLGTFVCNYFQPAIKKRFTGCFMLNSRQINLFLMIRNNFKGVVNYQIEAESKFTYDTWTKLSDFDTRF